MRTLTQLVGTTATTSATTYPSSFTSLALNNTAQGVALGTDLVNNVHRYLLQKYFNNESSYSITTIGSNVLTLTAKPVVGDTTATLSFQWISPSTVGTGTFSDGEQRQITFTKGSTAISWQNALTGTKFTLTNTVAAAATTATLTTPWAYTTGTYVIVFSDGETKTVTLTANSTAVSWSGGLSAAVQAYINTSINTTTLGVGGVQAYKLPPDYSKLKTGTLTIGSLKWTPTEILSRQEWDNLNVFPYYADIPNNFFIYNNLFNLWPIPSSTGNIISFNYKRRVPDLSITDVSAGTVSVAVNSLTVTGVTTGWTPTVSTNNESRWIQFSSPLGDNLWYQVQSVDSATSLTLYDPYYGTVAVSGGTYILGQMPLLAEDFHDMLVYGALAIYFSTIVSDDAKFKKFESLYNERLELLAEYSGTKTVNVNLSRRGRYANPNSFPQNLT